MLSSVKHWGAAAGLLAGLALAGCQQPLRADGNKAVLEIPAAQGEAAQKADAQDHPVELVMGQDLEVRLGSQAGTGYEWQLAGPAPAVVQMEGQPSTAPAAAPAGQPSGAVGAGTWTTFTFHSVACGDGSIRFLLRRSWEPVEQAARQVNVPLTVVAPKKKD